MFALLNELHILSRFTILEERFEPIRGWLKPIEGYTLWSLAAQGGGVGEIVEIGSFLGRSTCWLAAGAKEAYREKVTAIDHFKGSTEHQHDELLRAEGTTRPAFEKNLRRKGVSDYVNIIEADSAKAALEWDKPVRLLFIDGDHAYESCKRDFDAWAPFVTVGGFVCIHDIVDWKDTVGRCYHDIIETESGFEEVFTVANLGVLQRIHPPRPG